jgi:hypothetical protein
MRKSRSEEIMTSKEDMQEKLVKIKQYYNTFEYMHVLFLP